MEGIAIAGLIGSAVSAGVQIDAAQKQQDAVDRQSKLQDVTLQAEKQKQTQMTAEQGAASTKAKMLADKAQAKSTQNVKERQKRKGVKSLLTGTETGLQTIV